MRKLGKIKLLLTASTFPRWEGDTEPRFILDLAIAYTRFFDVTVLAPAAPGAARGSRPRACRSSAARGRPGTGRREARAEAGRRP